MQEPHTLQRSFGPNAGRFFEELLRSHGVTVHGEDELERFEGEERVSKVVTRGGIELAADDSLAEMRARNKFGMAMAAMIRMIATTISSSISEKPFCLFLIVFRLSEIYANSGHPPEAGIRSASISGNHCKP